MWTRPDNPMTDAMSDDRFHALAELIYQRTGIRFDRENAFILQRRLQTRMRALRLHNLEEYYAYLLYHPEREREIDELIDLVTNQETYFFREKQQLRCFREEILPLLIQEKTLEAGRTLRIWSAGCSTGEEPYTLAMLVKEASIPPDWLVLIFATDISSRALRLAREGIYGASSFRAVEPEYEPYVHKYFEPLGDGRLRIRNEIKRMVLFGRVNILDTCPMALFGCMDVIFCRNVLIYFDEKAKKRAIDNFYDRLRPGGFLLLGHSESLLGIDDRFRLIHFHYDMVYQK